MSSNILKKNYTCPLLFNLLLYNKFWTLPSVKKLQMTVSNLTKMVESSPDRVENAVEKGDVARYEQFLHFPLSFQKTCTADR